MSFIVMAIQEEGSEIRIGNEYPTRAAAYDALEDFAEQYVEYRNFWVEEYQDANYWYERFAREDYDPLDDPMNQDF